MKRNTTNRIGTFRPKALHGKRPLALEDDNYVMPTPCLRLTSFSLRVPGNGLSDFTEIPFTVALLHFDYDGTEVDPNSAPYQLQRRVGNRLVTTPRQHSAELAFAAQLISKTQCVQTFSRPSDAPRSRLAYTFLHQDGGESWLNFLHQVVPDLESSGWRVAIDKAFADRFKAVQIDNPDGPWDANLREQKGNAWLLSFDVGIMVEGRRVPLVPLLIQALKRMGSPTPEAVDTLALGGKLYVNMPDGRPLALPFPRVRDILMTLMELYGQKVSSDGAIPIPLDLAMALSSLDTAPQIKLPTAPHLGPLLKKLKGISGPAKVSPPTGLKATLRPYQRDGLNWLQFLREYGLGGILADDMGLGKTIQALAHILLEKESGRSDRPCLVVCPTSLIPNWESEADKFAPELKVLSLQGKDRSTRFGSIADADLVLTTYPLLARDAETILSTEWHIVVLDEAQAIKNPSTRATQIVCELRSRHRLCLTGTPVENHLGEVWSLFAFLMPGMLGNHRDFNKRFRNPIERQDDSKQQAALSGRLKPFILRRNKSDVAKELSPKTEIVHYVELNQAQRDLYETVRLMVHDKVQEVVSDKGLGRSRIIILDALLKLRQVCCDPRLVKLSSARTVKQSAKLESLLEMLPEMIEEGRRILLFSQFTSMLDLIKPELIKAGIPFVELRGDTTDRKTPVDRFQKCEVPLFLISLKAGGTGLNLTAADTVIHYDPWWNPAVEMQATDRAHRIGQTKPVFVYKFIAKGTVEERILDMQSRKRDLAGALFDDTSETGKMFTPEDIDLLFQDLK